MPNAWLTSRICKIHTTAGLMGADVLTTGLNQKLPKKIESLELN
jgi:hypothetical protein